MTRTASAFLFLFTLAVAPLAAEPTVPLAAGPARLVDDVIRMSRAGVSDEAIVAFVQTLQNRPPVTADEVIAMKTAGVSDPVIRAMIDVEPPRPAQPAVEPRSDDPQGENVVLPPPPDESVMAEGTGGGCVVFEPPIPPFYEPPYPSWIWDPNWYQPTLDARGGSNPMQHHEDTQRPVIDAATSAITQALGLRPPAKDRGSREEDSQQKPERTRDRDRGGHSLGDLARRF